MEVAVVKIVQWILTPKKSHVRPRITVKIITVENIATVSTARNFLLVFVKADINCPKIAMYTTDQTARVNI